MCIGSRAPNCRTVLQNGQDKTPKASPKKQSTMEYLPALQETKPLRSFSGSRANMLLKIHLGINVTPNITRSLDSFSTVPEIVNAGDWGCTVRDLETIIVLVSFNFIPQRSRHSLTLTRSRLRNSATVTLKLGDGTTAIKVESSPHRHNRSAYSTEWKKALRCTGATITGPKHCPAALLTGR